MVSPIPSPPAGSPDVGGLQTIVNQGFVAAAPYTTSHYVIDTASGAALLNVGITGHARLSRVYNYTDFHDAWFCTISSCKCPPRTIGALPPTKPLKTPPALGVTGDPGTGSDGRVRAFTLSDFCHPVPGSGGGGAGSASDLGDPHVEAFNHFRYDFQAAGEFTAVRSKDGSVDIQVRQQPQLGRLSSNISVLTGVAMRVAGHRVGVYVPASNPGAPPARGGPWVRIDGRLVNPGGVPLSLGSGSGVIRANAGNGLAQVFVTWPNGTTATVTSVFPTFMDLDVSLPRTEHGRVQGILGPFNAHPVQILRTRAGKAIDLHHFKTLYGTFANSWRVTPRTSLFDYARGKSTRSYQIRGFPRGPTTIAKLSPATRARAAGICDRAGVIQAVLLSDCIFDVGVTGNPAFAAGYASEATKAPSGCAASAAACLTVKVSITGDRSVTATVRQPIPERCTDYYPTQAGSGGTMALPAVNGTVGGHKLGIVPTLYFGSNRWMPGTYGPDVQAGDYQDNYFTWEVGDDGVYGWSTTDGSSGDPTATTNADGSGSLQFAGWKYEQDPSRTISGSESWTCKNRG